MRYIAFHKADLQHCGSCYSFHLQLCWSPISPCWSLLHSTLAKSGIWTQILASQRSGLRWNEDMQPFVTPQLSAFNNKHRNLVSEVLPHFLGDFLFHVVTVSRWIVSSLPSVSALHMLKEVKLFFFFLQQYIHFWVNMWQTAWSWMLQHYKSIILELNIDNKAILCQEWEQTTFPQFLKPMSQVSWHIKERFIIINTPTIRGK